MTKRQINKGKKQQRVILVTNKKLMQNVEKASNKKYKLKMSIIKKDLDADWLNPSMNNDAGVIYANAIKMVNIA